MKKKTTKKKQLSGSSKEDLKRLPATKLKLTRKQFKTIREIYFENTSGEINDVLLAAQSRGIPKLGNSDLVGNKRRGKQGLVNRYRWYEKRWAIERRLREEETIQDRLEIGASTVSSEMPGTEEMDAASGVADKSVRAPTLPFSEWLGKQEPRWKWNWRYQRLIYKALAKIDFKKPRRLMIFLPPRHGKSELITVRFIAWLLSKRPETKIIIGSYNQKLANKFSRRARRIHFNQTTDLEEPKGGLQKAADEWETSEGGGVKAVGVGAGVTGFGADLIIVDDPIKGRADANSENNREKVWEWFNDDLHTRLEPNGSIILIQTRWHEDDLAGRLLKQEEEGGEEWEVIRLPALAEEWSADTLVRTDVASTFGTNSGEVQVAEIRNLADRSVRAPAADPLGRKPGEALCPARFSREELLKKKAKMGTASFEALYQQNPLPADGGTFKVEWFDKVVDEMPPGLKWYRGYDLAVSTKTSADYTASFRCALDAAGNLYIADGFRKRIEYPDQRRYMIERMQEERNTEHGIEDALHGKAIIQDLRRERCIARVAFRGVKVTADKQTRAAAWAARAEEGKVILVRGPWIPEFLDELARFPRGKHDDQIDAVSIAVQMIDRPKHRHAGF